MQCYDAPNHTTRHMRHICGNQRPTQTNEARCVMSSGFNLLLPWTPLRTGPRRQDNNGEQQAAAHQHADPTLGPCLTCCVRRAPPAGGPRSSGRQGRRRPATASASSRGSRASPWLGPAAGCSAAGRPSPACRPAQGAVPWCPDTRKGSICEPSIKGGVTPRFPTWQHARDARRRHVPGSGAVSLAYWSPATGCPCTDCS